MVPKNFVANRPIDRDRMALLPRSDVAAAAIEVLHPLQNRTAEEIMLGTATLFAALCRRCGLDPHDMHAMATRVIDAPPTPGDTSYASIEVIRDFAGGRMMGQEVTIG